MPLSSFPPATAQQAGHRRDPGCVIEVDPVLALPQEMRSTECGHGHAEVTEVFDAGHVQPGQATTHTDAGLVHIPDVESEAGEASGGRPGLDQALAAVRAGDTLAVPKLDRMARSVPDAGAIADQLKEKGGKLALISSVYDPTDPMEKMFFNILAPFAEFEADLIRMRTREGMAMTRAKGKLQEKQPKLSNRQPRTLRRM